MGTADIVPGVSGGTIAFIFGIYEQLIYSIKKVSGESLRLFLRGKIKEGIASIPFGFLVPLASGIFAAIILLSSLLTYLLANHAVFVWSFFFGLIVASILIVRKRVVTWDRHDIAVFLMSAALAYIVVGAVPVETPATYLAFFLSGMIAIVAMILPGVSGSFLLVLMGKYEQILGAVVARDVIVLALVMAGAAVGISAFSRVLSWLFAKHHDIAIAALAGFMLGSLRKVWPWRETLVTRINSKGIEVPVVEANIFPNLNSEFLLAVGLALLGAFLLIKMERMQVVREQSGDLKDKKFEKSHKSAIASQIRGKV